MVAGLTFQNPLVLAAAAGAGMLAMAIWFEYSWFERTTATFPEGVDYEIVYDPTIFVRGSIEEADPVGTMPPPAN